MLSVRQSCWFEGMVKGPPIGEKTILAENFFENISLHFLSHQKTLQEKPLRPPKGIIAYREVFEATMFVVIRVTRFSCLKSEFTNLPIDK